MTTKILTWLKCKCGCDEWIFEIEINNVTQYRCSECKKIVKVEQIEIGK